MSDFSSRVRELRKELGVSQEVLAQIAEVNLRTWQRYESGENQPPLICVRRVAKYFGVGLEYIAGDSDDMRSVNDILDGPGGKTADDI